MVNIKVIQILSVDLLFAAFAHGDDSVQDEVIFYLSTDTLNETELNKNNLFELDATLPTVFIIHEWEGSAKDEWVVNLTEAYLTTGKYNIIAIDWSPIANNLLYPVTVAEVKEVGEYFTLAKL